MNSGKLGPQHAVAGVMPGHVVILWHELVFEYVTDLRMVLEPTLGPDGMSYLRISVTSFRYDDEHPAGYEYCWIYRDFKSMGYLMSPAQLFDLLIDDRDRIRSVLSRQ
jgi:hypothetical protein